MDTPEMIGLVRAALEEDIGDGDVTSLATVPASLCSSASLVAKAEGRIAGLEVFVAVFRELDPAVRVTTRLADGDRVKPGDCVLDVSGPARSILAGERTALNFLGRLSGIATATSRFVDAVAGTSVRIVDTRKTTPGWRGLEKAAVRAGGGSNHRFGLHDMMLLKENHIRAAGGITAAVAACRDYLAAQAAGREVALEVETTCTREIEEALAAGCDRIMLDNMSLEETAQAVRRIRREPDPPDIEASGNMTLNRVRAVAETGVDLISVGAITHSAPALDLSLQFTSSDDT